MSESLLKIFALIVVVFIIIMLVLTIIRSIGFLFFIAIGLCALKTIVWFLKYR